MERSRSRKRLILAVILLCFVGGIILWAQSSDAPEPDVEKVDTVQQNSPDGDGRYEEDEDKASSTFDLELDNGNNNATSSGGGTVTIAVTSKKSSGPAQAKSATQPNNTVNPPSHDGSTEEPEPEPDPEPEPEPNTAPILMTVLPPSGASTADENDNGTPYKALIFSATAEDEEDGDITDPSQYHWSNLTANCLEVGTDVCENEKTGNDFTMNLPISDVCPGDVSTDLVEEYSYRVTVEDSGGLTDSADIEISITYHCEVDPESVPELTIVSPAATGYQPDQMDDLDQLFRTVLFSATATDKEDGELTDPNDFTWRLISGECSEVFDDGNMSCQEEVNDNDFMMNMLGVCVNNWEDDAIYYTYEVSVVDSDGNTATEQVTFSLGLEGCGGAGN